MIENGWGRIVNISGLAARQSGSTLGSIRNVAVSAMTKNLADERPHGINVTVVHPGITRTGGRRRGRGACNGQHDRAHRRRRGSRVRGRVPRLAEECAPITGDAIACGGGAPRAIDY